MIDGCSRLGALFRVLVPVMLPGIAATFIFAFTVLRATRVDDVPGISVTLSLRATWLEPTAVRIASRDAPAALIRMAP